MDLTFPDFFKCPEKIGNDTINIDTIALTIGNGY